MNEFRMLTLKVSPEEMEAFEQEAAAAGRDPKKWVRRTLNEAVGAAMPGSLSSEGALDAEDVRRRLGISVRTLNNWIRLGGLPFVGTGKARRFLWKDVLAWYRADGTDRVDELLEDERKRLGDAELDVPEKEVVGRMEVARRLCLSSRTLFRYVTSEGMPYVKTGRKRTFVWGDVLEWYVLYRLRLGQKGVEEPLLPPRRRYRRSTPLVTAHAEARPSQSGVVEQLQAAGVQESSIVGVRYFAGGRFQEWVMRKPS